jgi:DNA invertase Pin-like site-specific DNA recombinase
VRAGLRLAKSKGKRLGHPRASVNPEQVATLRAAGASWKVISRELGIGVGTACRAR